MVPPDINTPPIIGAAKDASNQSPPIERLIPGSDAIVITAATPISSPERVWARNTDLLFETPDRRAANGLPPVARILRPMMVLLKNSESRIAVMMAITNM